MSSVNNKEKNFISAVVYLHNDGARAVEFCRAVAAELDAHFAQYELVVVDDACTDDTVKQLRAWGREQDAPLIAADINKAAGCDVRTLPYLHWWSFLALFDAIGEGSFATVVAIRDKLRRGRRLENWELDFYRTHRAVVELRAPETAEAQAEKRRLLAMLG